MSAEGVSPALIAALSGAEAVSVSTVTALMHFVARECYRRVESFDWRAIHRTYHMCVLSKDGGRFVALIGADAPIVALANERNDMGWSFFDDASMTTALSGYYSRAAKMLAAKRPGALTPSNRE